MKRPSLSRWRHWTWDDYLTYFLSMNAVRARIRGEPSVAALLDADDFVEFCRPIRERIEHLFSGSSPRVSIQMPARNDEAEILPTLVSYTLLDTEPGFAELIVADNASSDHTADVIRNCGAKYAFASVPGMGKARRAAYDAMAKSVEYVWLTDCDARVVAPLRWHRDLSRRSSILATCTRCLDGRPNAIGLSSGIVYEWTHLAFRLVRAIAVAAGKAPRVHTWTGPNQFVRRSALDAIGGIHPNVDYRAREDGQRMYELARYGKAIHADMLSAASDASLYDPVYHSGRRRATVADVLRAVAAGRVVPRLPKDCYGWPIHPEDRIRA